MMRTDRSITPKHRFTTPRASHHHFGVVLCSNQLLSDAFRTCRAARPAIMQLRSVLDLRSAEHNPSRLKQCPFHTSLPDTKVSSSNPQSRLTVRVHPQIGEMLTNPPTPTKLIALVPDAEP